MDMNVTCEWHDMTAACKGGMDVNGINVYVT